MRPLKGFLAPLFALALSLQLLAAPVSYAASRVTISDVSNGDTATVTGHALNVNATASVTGFRPTAVGTPISVTTGGVTGTLPAGAEVVATNVGTTNGAYCQLGASATTSSQYIAPNGGWFGFAISGDTQLTCITSASTTTVTMVGGSGLPTGTGGGGGGGGGGAVTVADGADVTLGAKADAANCATTNTLIACERQLHTDITGAIPAGTNVIGYIGGDGTAGTASTHVVTVQGIASGTPQPVSAASGAIVNGGDVVEGNNTDSAACTSGTSLIACARQLHTDATAAIPAGTNVIGHVIADTGSTAVVTNAGAFAVQAQPTPVTSGGLTNYVVEPGASDNHANIKNGAGQVYYLHMFNNSATINYVRLYNAATGFNGCNSATNLVWEGHIPANTSDAGFVVDISQGIAFSTGISICITGAYGQTSTTNATATAMSVNVGYK